MADRSGPPPGPGAFARQLAPPAYVLDLRPPSARPSPPARPAPPGGPAGPPEPGVLLLSRVRDPGLDAVQRLLRRAGVPVTRINADELATADLVVDPARRAACVAGRWLAPTVTWIRHFSPRAVEGQATGTRAVRLFAQDSWHGAASALAAISGAAIGSARPGILAQLDTAARCGVAVPRTVVSTSPARAAGLLGGDQVIVKALHEHFVEAAPGRLTGVFPVVVPRASLAGWPAAGPPVIVQEYVPHEVELRVYAVHGRLHGFAVTKAAPADPWLDRARVGARRTGLPAAVAAAAHALTAAFGLRYGAFDFLVRDGAPVFLEVNPDGDWSWAETLSGAAPVTAAAAGMLCDLHRARLPAGPGQFSLLGFLAG
jgi:hypothetical protein